MNIMSKISHIGVWIGIGISLVSLGCTTVRITSKHDVTFNKTPHKIFILDSITKDFHPHFKESFEQNITHILKECKIDSYFHTRSSLELDPDSIKKLVKEYSPDFIMLLDRIGGTKNQYGSIMDVEYDIKLIDVSSNKHVWRANVFFKPEGTAAKNAEILAIEITNKLKLDNIVQGCAVITRN